MDQQQTIELWNRCQAAKRAALDAGADDEAAHEKAVEVWNGWAEPLLAQRKKLEEAGEWAVDETNAGQNEPTIAWQNKADCDFQSVGFKLSVDEYGSKIAISDLAEKNKSQHEIFVECEGNSIDFRNFYFPDDMQFSKSTFFGRVRFDDAFFGG